MTECKDLPQNASRASRWGSLARTKATTMVFTRVAGCADGNAEDSTVRLENATIAQRI